VTSGGPGDRPASGRPILAFDTATTVAVVALGDPTGRVLAEAAWAAGYRHGEELLVRVDRLMADAGVSLTELGGIVVGTGPGAFTGLRVGLATAKGLAHGLGIPVAGVPTRQALQDAVGKVLAASGRAGGPVALLLPAGPSDRLVVEPGGATELLTGGGDPALDPTWTVAAVDLGGRAPDAAVSLGEEARPGLAAALVGIGAGELAAGRSSDLATLVPEYVTLPRGVHREIGEMAWSRGPR
jgi:tRNA threonylcarbamoyladenosine biosynthesis protein TsaB